MAAAPRLRRAEGPGRDGHRLESHACGIELLTPGKVTITICLQGDCLFIAAKFAEYLDADQAAAVMQAEGLSHLGRNRQAVMIAGRMALD